MPTFRVKLSSDQKTWVPAHAELANHMAAHAGPEVTEEQARGMLWRIAEELVPGEYTLDYDLEELRGEVLARIDARSDELLKGFEYNGVVFSLSEKAQIRYEYMDRTADTLPYPLPINSLDDRDMLVLTDPAQTHEFCHASTVHVLTVIGSGTQQKDIIRAATTIEELQAYVDPR